jgi:RNA polymerase sigma-70 factor, ECF subfamily
MSDGAPVDETAQELDQCFRDHYLNLMRHASFMTRGDTALADDLVQDAFLAAVRSWHELRTKSQAEQRAWLRATVRNLAVTAFRHNSMKRRRQSELDDLYHERESETDREAIFGIALKQCWLAIDGMPEGQHLVALLRWKEGLTPLEIADALGIAVGTVHAQLHNARRRLRAELGPYDPFAEDHPEGGDDVD